LAVASTTVAGTYTITVTGTGGGITHTATVSLTVTAPSGSSRATIAQPLHVEPATPLSAI
jgi:hypothetical protein